MVKNISNGDDPDFKYGGKDFGPPSQEPSGSEESQDFQGYLNKKSSQPPASQAQSPMEMMRSKNQSSFGAPTDNDPESEAAPENFGPPGISQIGQKNASNFGAPGFGLTQDEKVPANSSTDTEGEDSPVSSEKTSEQDLAPAPANNPNPPPLEPPTLGPGGTYKPKDPKQTHLKHFSLKEIREMEVDNMLHQAMKESALKDPDPGAWQ